MKWAVRTFDRNYTSNESGIAVDRRLKSGRLDLVALTPDEMVDLAADLLVLARRVRERTPKQHTEGEGE